MTLIEFALLVLVIGFIILGSAALLFKVLFPDSYWKERSRRYKL